MCCRRRLLSAVVLFYLRNATVSPEPSLDASRLTWSHATNSRELLLQALKGDKYFLEADVTWGTLVNQSDGQAIMAHPPDIVSDISLDQWLDMVKDSTGPRKGIKLDFKSDVAFNASLPVLRKHREMLPQDLWLNADILPGPWEAPPPNVSAGKFVLECSNFPSTLSPGWTTTWDLDMMKSQFRYSWQDVWLMTRTLACIGDEQRKHFRGITFPVRAIFVANSVSQLTWLLAVTGENSSLTVWSNELDFTFKAEDLLSIRRVIPESQVYYDLPDDQAKAFLNIKDSVTYQPSKFEPDLWAVLLETTVPFGCEERTYVTQGIHILHGGGRKVAVVYNQLLTFPLNISGRFRPYEHADYSGNYIDHEGAVTLVITSNRSYWDNDWNNPDMSRTALALGIYKSNTSFSDCVLEWRVEAASSNMPIKVDTNDSCLVEVTRGTFTLPPDSSVIVGFVFTGGASSVMEGIQIKGTIVRKVYETKSRASTTISTLNIVLSILILHILLQIYLG